MASGIVRYDDYGWILSGFPMVKDLQAHRQAACCPLSACNVYHYSDGSLTPLRSMDRCLWPTQWWSSSCMIVILALISRPTKQFQNTSGYYYHFYTNSQCYLSNLRWRRKTWRICSGAVSQIRKLIITARKLENIPSILHSATVYCYALALPFPWLALQALTIMSITASTPSLLRTEVKRVGPVPRMAAASRRMTSREAPTWGARSIC